MASAKNETKSALRDFVYGDLDCEGLSRKIKNIERNTKGANAHNIGMAASAYLSSSPINEEAQREAKEAIISVFSDRDMKRVFAHDFVEEVRES